MLVEITERGFELVNHRVQACNASTRLVQQSSAIGDYDGAAERPGSSALWIGADHHLNREETAELVGYLTRWLTTGSLGDVPPPPTGSPDELKD